MQKGHVDFAIKVYPRGTFTSLLSALKIGDTVEAKGPRGRMEYSEYVGNGAVRAYAPLMLMPVPL